MKHYLKTILASFSLFLSPLGAKEISEDTFNAFVSAHSKGFIYLLSFPRSGNTWLRYALEYITGRPSGEIPQLLMAYESRSYENVNSPHGLKFNFPLDFSKEPLVKIHSSDYAWFSYRENVKLILVVRNYRECLMSHAGSMKELGVHIRTWGNMYVENLKIYDEWDPNKRLLVYYEDLISSPEVQLKRICEFLGENEKARFCEFMENYEAHKKACLCLYEQEVKVAHSKGESDSYYSDKMQIQQIEQIDNFMKKQSKYLYNLYLTRYQKY